MPHTEPLDFLHGRTRDIRRQVAQERHMSAGLRGDATRVSQRAQAARLQARLYTQHATDLCRQGAELCDRQAQTPGDAATRARRVHDELAPRRIANRLKQQRSG